MTQAQFNYRQWLKTRKWKDLSKKAKEFAGGRCVKCGIRNGVEAHHKFYRDDWNETQLEDLVVLCRGCHEAEHGIDDRKWIPDGDVDLDIAFERIQDLSDRVIRGRGLKKADRKFLRRGLERWAWHGGFVWRVIRCLDYVAWEHWNRGSGKEASHRSREKIMDYYVRTNL